MVEKKKLCLLQIHGGRISRALDFRPMRHSHEGRRGWKYHASCSVNLLKSRNNWQFPAAKSRLAQSSFNRMAVLALSLAYGKGAKSFIPNAQLTTSGYRDLQVHA
jgi:hypothetical protein